jgi:hypothetical protein
MIPITIITVLAMVFVNYRGKSKKFAGKINMKKEWRDLKSSWTD